MQHAHNAVPAVRRSVVPTAALSLFAIAAVLLLSPNVSRSASAAPAPAVVDRVLSDQHIVESSSLTRSAYGNGVLWTSNDSGGGPVLYAIGKTGATLATYTVANASAKDWEAMAQASSGSSHWIYIGDIGDNGKKRPTIAVHRVVEPQTLKNGTLSATTWTFRYPDGPHNAETMLVNPVTLRLYIVTKDTAGGVIFEAPTTLSTTAVNTLVRVGTAPVTLSDGAFIDGSRFVLRGYERAYLYSRLGAAPVVFGMPQPGESITPGYTAGTVYTGEEGTSSKVWRVTTP
jgi:hypothetical protein